MKFIAIIATTMILASGTANAQGRAEMRKAVQELGVSPREMVGCMKQSGMKRSQNLSEEQRAEVGASLLNCLQKKNPDLTKEKFVSTMIRFRKR
jgi:small ligand-binding sensory domain FIST